jgi:hypothetical protein
MLRQTHTRQQRQVGGGRRLKVPGRLIKHVQRRLQHRLGVLARRCKEDGVQQRARVRVACGGAQQGAALQVVQRLNRQRACEVTTKTFYALLHSS